MVAKVLPEVRGEEKRRAGRNYRLPALVNNVRAVGRGDLRLRRVGVGQITRAAVGGVRRRKEPDGRTASHALPLQRQQKRAVLQLVGDALHVQPQPRVILQIARASDGVAGRVIAGGRV